MSEITIDKHVEIPAYKQKRPYKKTLDNLSIGDSFLAPLTDRQNLSSLINHEFHMVCNKRFTTSSKDQPEGQFRVWRVEDFKIEDK